MKAVISNFSIYKTLVLTKTLPVIFIFLIFFTSCKIFYDNSGKISQQNDDILRTQIISTANNLIGSKYRYGGINPQQGFDCSGFTYYVFKKHKIILPHSSSAQSKKGKKIKLKNAKPGDLVFFKRRGKINHVGIVISNSRGHLYVIHSTTSKGVKKDDILNSKYWKKKLTFATDIISN